MTTGRTTVAEQSDSPLIPSHSRSLGLKAHVDDSPAPTPVNIASAVNMVQDAMSEDQIEALGTILTTVLLILGLKLWPPPFR